MWNNLICLSDCLLVFAIVGLPKRGTTGCKSSSVCVHLLLPKNSFLLWSFPQMTELFSLLMDDTAFLLEARNSHFKASMLLEWHSTVFTCPKNHSKFSKYSKFQIKCSKHAWCEHTLEPEQKLINETFYNCFHLRCQLEALKRGRLPNGSLLVAKEFANSVN